MISLELVLRAGTCGQLHRKPAAYSTGAAVGREILTGKLQS